MDRCQTQRDKASIKGSEKASKKELDVVWRRVESAATILAYLKARARLMAVPQNDCSLSGSPYEEAGCQVSSDEQDHAFVGVVTNGMDALLERVLMAESEAAVDSDNKRVS
ncbi:hypothetical protein Dimus_014070 [Dionaea muscipula]